MPKRAITAEDLLRMQFIGDVQISPDGQRLLFSKRHIEKNKYVTNLFTIDTVGFRVKQWTQGQTGAGFGRWAPDGQTIAFIGGRDKPGAQIYLLDVNGGEARKLTSLPEGTIGSVMWSPDGNQLAFTFRESHPNWTEKAKKAREADNLSDPPWEIDDVFYRMDGDGYFGGQRFRMYVCDVESGSHRLLYDRDPMGSFSFDWLKDSSGLVVAHSTAKNPYFDKADDQLFLVPLKGRPRRIPCTTKGTKGTPRVSPNGKTVAFLGNASTDDPWGDLNTQLWTLPLTGGEPKCLTTGDDYCLEVLTLGDTMLGHTADGGGSGLVQWTPDGKRIYVGVGHKGAVDIGAVDAQKGGLSLLTQGNHVVIGSNLSKDGLRMATAFGDATHLMEAGYLDLSKPAKPKILSRFNEKLLSEIALSIPVEKWVPSTDGSKVHTWHMPAIGSKGKAPTVLEIHGGPHAQYGWSLFHEFQVLCAQGYNVVFSNPRGSKGYGEAFCGIIRGDWGNKDWDDLAAVKDWIKKQSWADPAKIGVMGGSYGGYMTNWAISHTHDFVAAITDRSIVNWCSAGSTSDFPLNRDGVMGGLPWEAHAKVSKLWQQSPISHFSNVKTPTLVIHSEGDLRCNVEQGEQVFFALKSLGIETRFVRYPTSTSHGLSRGGPPDLRLHRLREITSWWKRWYN